MKENVIKGTVSVALAALSAYMGELLIPLAVLLAAMIADYVSGMAKAWITKQLSSRIGITGIVKKLCYLLIVCVGMGIDWVIGASLNLTGVHTDANSFVALLVIVWLIINEMLSIVENVAETGVNVPGWLLKCIGRLKNSVENKGQEESGEEKE